MEQHERLTLAASFVDNTGENIFLTGRAGTGKTTFLKSLQRYTSKRMVVVAPTGVAALNAGGMTIHSFFQFKPQTYIPGATTMEFKAGSQKRSIMRSLDLLVIDEISMVRCDLLDAIDAALRHYRNSQLPFGGVQLLMIGDMQQLSPVVADQEWEFLSLHYSSSYFFESHALRKSLYTSIELTKIFRQKDSEFIDILNACRDCRYDKVLFDKLNSRYIPSFEVEEGYITLTTHNSKAKAINDRRMAAIDEPSFTYEASISGEFGENIYPCDEFLTLKLGAQVMFIKNDISPEKLYYNGKIGQIIDIDEDFIEVDCEDGEPIMVEPQEWENSRYTINQQSKEIERHVIGRFVQYPLRAAWAITIHKSQGLTFDRAIIDVSGAFAFGQAYVALSRCRTLEGIVLSERINGSVLKSEVRIEDFTKQIEENHPTDKTLEDSKERYHVALLCELFNMDALCSKLRQMSPVLEAAAQKVYPQYYKRWSETFVDIEKDIAVISKRFVAKILSHSLQGEVAHLNERIEKGATYFNEKIEGLIVPLIGDWNVDIDNKENQKVLDNLFASIKELTYHKVELLKTVDGGFSVTKYIKRRALVALEKPKFASIKSTEKSVDTVNPILFEQLRLWRRAISQQKEIPAFVVASQASLNGICELLPCNKKELKKVKGIGDGFISKYGAEVLAIVERYCENTGIKKGFDLITDYKTEKKKSVKKSNVKGLEDSESLYVKPPKPAKSPKPAKEPKTPTRDVTHQLYCEGLTPLEIATKRELTIGTIYSHLCHFVSNGVINPNDLVAPEVITIIEETISQNPDAKISEIKDLLPIPVAYYHINVVFAKLQRL